MKVLYDITVLGLGHIVPKARTGIFRVIENVAEQLVINQECEMLFCSGTDIDTINNSLKYLKDKKSFSHIPFSVSSILKKNDYKQKRLELIKSIHSSEHKSLITIFSSKVRVRNFMFKEKIIDLTQGDDCFIKPADLKSSSIYHSSFYPIPTQVKGSAIKAVFLTSYDLIPILYPQFAEESVIELIQKVLQSITPDTWVLCISEATRNDLLNYLGNRVDPNKVKVTELAASGTFYQSRNKAANKEVRGKYGIPDAPYILSLCTLEPRKNIDQAIRAFVKIVSQENVPELNLVLVGTKGWMFDKIFDEIKGSAGIKDRIIITGYVPDEDLAAIYSDALLFVYPSFYEGFGLPPLEAMQCGVPVITSNTSSLPEVVGDAGIMVAPTDLDALCQGMLSIYNNPALREKMVEKSIERAGRFSWERCANETVEAYKSSLN
ncbi:glycosyltransferase family 4 protein [Pontibacter pamirensis]|uniref:glycosyltransferase family 4 protein n=1 Tax=Pontibacter pamirensis TaxID=2562824 RepID=UPI00138970BA|nr:glycosyltransferase family 1 protein [Pontibacter pamirensis]